MAFHFKQFSIADDQSTMKVGTDAVLLGAWTDVENAENILDIGCGSGVISLMLAQRTNAKIEAIDIDEDSVKQARENFKNSPWADQLEAFHYSLKDFRKTALKKYDLIVSNPPYFINALKSPDKNKNRSKHSGELSYVDLTHNMAQLLSQTGKACLILPSDIESKAFKDLALLEKIHLNKQLLIKPKANKKANRVLMEFSFLKSDLEEDEMYLREDDNQFSETYKSLCKDYYLNR